MGAIDLDQDADSTDRRDRPKPYDPGTRIDPMGASSVRANGAIRAGTTIKLGPPPIVAIAVTAPTIRDCASAWNGIGLRNAMRASPRAWPSRMRRLRRASNRGVNPVPRPMAAITACGNGLDATALTTLRAPPRASNAAMQTSTADAPPKPPALRPRRSLRRQGGIPTSNGRNAVEAAARRAIDAATSVLIQKR